MANKFRLLLKFRWVSSGGKKYSLELVTARRVVAKLSLFVGSGDLIIVVCGWLWVVAVKSWLVVGGRGWRR